MLVIIPPSVGMSLPEAQQLQQGKIAVWVLLDRLIRRWQAAVAAN